MRVVNSLDELLELPADKCVNGFRARTPVKLEIPDLSSQAQSGAQAFLNDLQARRGSMAGAAFMFLTLLYGVIQVFHRNTSMFTVRALVELAAVLIVSFGVGFTAKYTALLVTRWQFARRCRAQHRLLSAAHGHSAAG